MMMMMMTTITITTTTTTGCGVFCCGWDFKTALYLAQTQEPHTWSVPWFSTECAWGRKDKRQTDKHRSESFSCPLFVFLSFGAVGYFVCDRHFNSVCARLGLYLLLFAFYRCMQCNVSCWCPHKETDTCKPLFKGPGGVRVYIPSAVSDEGRVCFLR
jgi:hypothetical protein